jgi:hypothetical protein
MDKNGRAKDKPSGRPAQPSFEEKVKAAGDVRIKQPKASGNVQPEPSKP